VASATARVHVTVAPAPSVPPAPVAPADQPLAATWPRRVAWREAAACLGCSPSQFFPHNESEEAVPKAVCTRCAVRVECLVDAILTREHEGVRGGLNERERRSLTRRAKRRARQAGCSTLVALMTCLSESGAFAIGPREPLLDRDAVGG
jgi:WhiB family redox-sensing transcriptional regulator